MPVCILTSTPPYVQMRASILVTHLIYVIAACTHQSHVLQQKIALGHQLRMPFAHLAIRLPYCRLLTKSQLIERF